MVTSGRSGVTESPPVGVPLTGTVGMVEVEVGCVPGVPAAVGAAVGVPGAGGCPVVAVVVAGIPSINSKLRAVW